MFYTGGQQSTAFCRAQGPSEAAIITGAVYLIVSRFGFGNCGIVALWGNFHTPSQSVRALRAVGRQAHTAVYVFLESSRALHT